ncbi:peptide deformylase [Weissella tructae]|uniref:Peptide deformylase n=2 Tax=Weissella TaxID=46255 RepID=A0A075TZV3_9LACO|nr:MULTISPECIES: peptide deformylase [Weissella]AIG65418.1 Peptide deformylase [Weissella tructae]AIM62731.1 Peptide deformylase [Weissella ceti]AIM64067.1 Peptide deformylase [Weissella ceti]ELA07122.1 peptide deformylase [Weissella ceti NC36]QVV91795.1 peptide deformylase [Weissella tructae]
MYLMKDIVRDGDPVLRQQAAPVSFPLSEEDETISENLIEYLIASQDPDESEELGLRPGVGIAAPQVGISKQMTAILIPNDDFDEEQEESDENDPYVFAGVIYNPVITRQSVKQTALATGEGCLSVDEDIPGFVERSQRITVRYQDEEGDTYELKLNDYPAIVFQHEIDHLHGTLFYDHIDKSQPWERNERTKYIG